MKLCVIGNSHAGMLAAAAQALPTASIELAVWAKTGLSEDDLTLEGSVLSAQSDDMLHMLQRLETPETIDLSDYDGLIFAGMSATMFTAVGLLRHHRPLGWPLSEEESAALETGQVQLLSEAALQAALVQATTSRMTYRLLHRLRQASDLPVWIVHQPYPSERMLRVKKRFNAFKKMRRIGAGAHLAQALEDSYERAYAPLQNVTLLPQLSETVAHGFLTKRAFTRDAVRLNIKHRQSEEDILHANAAFGDLALQRILAAAS